jgi:hypothetical protein
MKRSAGWQKANAEYNAAHMAHRSHNQHFLKEYKKEIAQHREAERASRVRATTQNKKY